jgi:methylmalonyl-CoA/ethylmalonyl-CoA epimerase
MRFHHVAYAVRNIQQYLHEFVDPLLSPDNVSAPIADPIQNVKVCFVALPGRVLLELVEPLSEQSPVNAIIERARGGLYHVCYEVDHLDAALERFRSKKCLPLGPAVPAAAFDGRRIVFLLTPQRDLIELVESARDPDLGGRRT